MEMAWMKAELNALNNTSTSKIYRVQVGAYSNKANALAMQKKLKSQGYDAIIKEG